MPRGQTAKRRLPAIAADAAESLIVQAALIDELREFRFYKFPPSMGPIIPPDTLLEHFLFAGLNGEAALGENDGRLAGIAILL